MLVHRSLTAALVLSAAALTGCAAETDETPAEMWISSCAGCHGNVAQGTDIAPGLGIDAQTLTVAHVVDVILDGEGAMDPVPVEVDEAEAIADFLVNDLLLR